MHTSTQQLWFTAPLSLEVRECELPAPAAGQLVIKSICSAVSAGTEMLVYCGQLPDQMSLDASLPSLQSDSSYPLQYGYACVGEVVASGDKADKSWIGKRVFSFQPHVSHFIASPEQLIVVPDDVPSQSAVFLANMETAVNLVQDGAPGIGEQVVVLGQGIVGLLLSGILATFPLTGLYTFDGIPRRREASKAHGVTDSFDPRADLNQLQSQALQSKGADLIYEVSGVPDALNLAIRLSGFDSRIVVGSWYGNKSSAIALGGEAHRNRLKITTSQVSTLAPALTGRWDKTRRFDVAWDMIRRLQPQKLVSHNLALSEADKLYKLLHNKPDEVMQALFVYP
ncbi:MAG: oxidoreductase [Gammaproteobacteria bacterium]|nr:oxidoreductase [Gammaproteobacteria bacterium]